MSHICRACGTEQSRPSSESPSNFGVEILVWIGALILAAFVHWLVLLGALAFSFWRFAARRPGGCMRCRSRDVIPIDSPLGRQLLEQLKKSTPAGQP